MEFLNERLQFLDLTSASDKEQSCIEEILFTCPRPLQVLPWCTSNKNNYCYEDGAKNQPDNCVEIEGYQRQHPDAVLRDARNQPTQTEDMLSCHPMPVYPIVPSGVFVPGTSLHVVHSSYPPRIPTHVMDVAASNGTDDPSKRESSNGPGKQQDDAVLRDSVSPRVERYHQPQHFRTLQAAMQPYYLQGSPSGTFLYMQPAVFSPPPQVFDAYGRPSSVLPQQTEPQQPTNLQELQNNNNNDYGSTESVRSNILDEKPPENIDEEACRQMHEHLCYHTEVVVKLPPRKNRNIADDSIQQEPTNQTICENEETLTDRAPDEETSPVSQQQSVKNGSTDKPARNAAAREEEEEEEKIGSKWEPSANQAQNKSWASLFEPMDKVRPMARVSPRIKTNPQLMQPPAATRPLSTSDASNSYLSRLGEFLSSYEPDHKIVSLQPRGLTNRNNWCYVNAILQSLIACPPFYNLMKAVPIEPRKRYPETLIMDNLSDFVREFLPANSRIGKREKCARNRDGEMVEIFTGPAFEPSGIYKILDKLGGETCFDIQGRQEDAEEFLSCLLNGLNDEMYELIKAVKPFVASASACDTEAEATETADSAWTVMGPKNKSSVTRRAVCGKTPISDIFRGQLRSRVLKAGDQPPTDNVQPFFTLQLDIEKTTSVKEALELLVGKDVLEGVTCSKTHRQVEAWTQMTLEDLPIVLILHLKCFLYKSDGCSKIVKCVEFPVDLKIDGKCMSANRKNKYTLKQRSYKLIAAVHHDGKEATRGHYVTDAYHVGYGCWIRYDDGAVRSVPESSVLKPRAPRVPYLLYYRRGDTIGGK